MSQARDAQPVHLAFHGIGISIESELESFARYAAKAMEPFVVREAPVRVRTRLEWVEGPPSRDPQRAFGMQHWDKRPDRDLYISGATACWLRIDDFEDLQILASWQGGCLDLRARYHFRLGRGSRGEALRRLYYRRRLETLRARRFSTLLYYLVYHPALWMLSRERGWHVLHAGAVASATGAAVFAGLPGCGKSTLAVAMTADPAWTMMSDNLLLHDGERVLACPELLLLDDRSIARVGEAAKRLKATGERRVYEREAYRPDRYELGPATPLAIFNVGRARKTELIPVEPAACVTDLARDIQMAKEVRRIVIMAEVLDSVADKAAPDAAAALVRLTRGSSCYRLWIEEGADLADVIRSHVAPALMAVSRRRRVSA